ncbi:MAG TPA: ring-cleaving dioxygenase [Chloroflexota bacterium]|nr:ring-cleaving dioxygenase [Chloroflexota bacterium]
MEIQLGGLHHVTAITGDAAGNVRFYTRVLGLRLVKKTVNQDDVSAYHLFYGDAVGHPGTEITFFDWPDIGPYLPGTGAIAAIGLQIPNRAALAWWERRLTALGIQHDQITERNGRAVLPLVDPEGQRLELVALNEAELTSPGGVPWEGSPIPAAYQIRGLSAVRIVVASGEMTTRLLTDTLGFRQTGAYVVPSGDAAGRMVRVFAIGPGGPGAEVHLEERPDLRPARLGIGGVHHVAFRTPGRAEQQAWRQHISAAGLGVTPIIDRYYFTSIYFREPGGVLFEIATDGPGFAVDEDIAHLGERLALPPFLEPYRGRIEASLRPIVLDG